MYIHTYSLQCNRQDATIAIVCILKSMICKYVVLYLVPHDDEC